MKRILCLLFSLITFEAFSQNAPTEVTLVVSADGATKTEAVDNALRSAVEQTYGTFVSANTTILDDELVKDEIATVSSGNIQKYTEIASVTLPNGNTSVTLDVTVSIIKLVSYAKSKGSECEFAGATFGANKRLYDFNKANEIKAIENMIKQIDALRPVYDYEIKVTEPVILKDGKNAEIKIQVTVLSNDKTKLFNDIIKNTVMSLAMTKEQIAPMENVGFKYEEYLLVLDGELNDLTYRITEENYEYDIKLEANPKKLFYFYTNKLDTLDCILENALLDYALTDNLGNEYVYMTVGNNSKRFIGHRFNGNNAYFWWMPTSRPAWYHYYSMSENGGYDYGYRGFEFKKVLAINNSKNVWTFPPINYHIPVKEIGLIDKISITPTKTDATNFVISKYHQYKGVLMYPFNVYNYNYRNFSYFYSKTNSSQDINKAIEIYKDARKKYLGTIEMKNIEKELCKLKNK